ncbi:MAG: hypothetical protein AAGG48_14570 [Planctomycetota bacterium]
MSEAIVKIGAGSSYTDGDVLFACNRGMIARVWAQQICSVRDAQRNGSGWILVDSVARDWFEQTHQFRFRRVSATEVIRINLLTRDRTKLSELPNDDGEAIDIRRFLSRRKSNTANAVFGEDGSEIWYGGRVDTSAGRMAKVWQRIARKTPHKAEDMRHQFWPMGRLDIRSHLAIRIDEATDQQIRDITSPRVQRDQNGRRMWKRKRDDGTDEMKASESGPPDDRKDWQPATNARRSRRIAWRRMLTDLNETEPRVRDAREPVGDELPDKWLGKRYRSKQQPKQRLNQIEEKGQED